MAATRLSDSQKIEIVARYRAGEGSSELADAYGCSANTVSRAVKAALAPDEYEQLKQQRSGRGVKASAGDPAPPRPPSAAPAAAPAAAEDAEVVVLAIDDADDFADDFSDDDTTDDPEDTAPDEGEAERFVAVPLLLGEHATAPAECQPLADAPLPASVYMLVDKTVELQARPLKEFPELGQLPAEDGERQALVVFANPRQAKRHCGRSQRVIKVPDTRVLERTAPYLIAQGISRVVLEGSLYSLPGS